MRRTVHQLIACLAFGCLLPAALTFAESDLVLQERLVGTWKETRRLGSQTHTQRISLKRDGSFEVEGIQRSVESTVGFVWGGTWEVTKGKFKYVTTFSDSPDLFPIGESSEDKIVSVSKSEWVMIEKSTGNESRARRLK